MDIVTLSELIPSHDHDLWCFTERSDFAQNVLACAAVPYAKYKRVPRRLRTQQTGNGCYSEIMQLLEDMFERDYNGRAHLVGRQLRIAVKGANEVFLDFVLLKAKPVGRGFDASFRVSHAVEKASLLHQGAFEFVAGHPCTRGILLVYQECPTIPGHVEMWLAHEWQATAISSMIVCSKCAYLGSTPFDASGNIDSILPDTPVRGLTGSKVEMD